MNTLKFYEENADTLIKTYQDADMTSLHQVLSKYINHQSNVIDVGFGSSRELSYLHSKGCNIWGIDPTDRFIENAKNMFPAIKEHFIKGSLPRLVYSDKLNSFFDIVLSIAVLMHIKKVDYPESVKHLVELAKESGKIILSYSIGSRHVDDGRYFETIDEGYLIDLFQNYNFKIIEKLTSDDGLGRKEQIVWNTLILSK